MDSNFTHMKKLLIPFCSIVMLTTACKRTDVPASQETNSDVTTTTAGRQCAADEVLQRQIAENPDRSRVLEELERRANSGMRPARAAQRLYIPVVVHVVLPNAGQVTTAQINSQIDVLTKDYTKTNSELSNTGVYLAGYPFNNVANPDIQFYVSQVIYKNSSVATFGTNDAVKKSSQGGSDAVNPTTMLNLWVCDLSSGLLGYVQFPGGAAATDGVVIDYQAFGTSASYPMYSVFNLGRTATHEVGHWLNLRHIWGDRRCGDDLVGDTPTHDDSNGGCPGTNHTSRCAGKPLEQWMNYMDYTDDRCMYMFSSGQKSRMDLAIDGPRAGYMRTSIQ